MEPQNNKFMSNIELDSYNIHNRGISEDVVRLPRKNDISENQNNLTKSKMDFTYKSNIAYGPLFENYAICSGYTDLMELFLEKLNIKDSSLKIYNILKELAGK